MQSQGASLVTDPGDVSSDRALPGADAKFALRADAEFALRADDVVPSASGIGAIPSEWGLANAWDVKAYLMAQIEAGQTEFDLSGVNRLGTMGAEILIAACKECDARGLNFFVKDPSPAIIETFALLGLGSRLVFWEPI